MRRVVRLSNFRGRRHSTAAATQASQLDVLIRERATDGAVCKDTGMTYAAKYDCALLDGATVTIRLAGVNHFDEPKWAHPTVRQAYEDLFNGSAGPAFVIPPK